MCPLHKSVAYLRRSCRCIDLETGNRCCLYNISVHCGLCPPIITSAVCLLCWHVTPRTVGVTLETSVSLGCDLVWWVRYCAHWATADEGIYLFSWLDDAFILWGNQVLERILGILGARPHQTPARGPIFHSFSHREAEDVAGVEGSDLCRKGRTRRILTRTCWWHLKRFWKTLFHTSSSVFYQKLHHFRANHPFLFVLASRDCF